MSQGDAASSGGPVPLPRLSERREAEANEDLTASLGHLHAPRADAGLLHAPSPLSAHSSNSADFDAFNSGLSLPRSLTPAHLLRPLPLLLLSCWLVALSTANALVGFQGLGGHECAELGGMLLWVALAAGATIPLLHLLAHAMKQEQRRARMAASAVAPAAGAGAARANPSSGAASNPSSSRPLSSTLRWALLGMLLLSTPSALLSITWLADGRCPRRRGVRQLALVDLILVLSLLVLVGLYWLLGRLPRSFARQLSRSGGKTLALVVLLSALIGNIVQLKTHDAEWAESYHWSFTPRADPCTHSCLAARQSPSLREVVCRDSSGVVVESAHCAGGRSGGMGSRNTHPTALVSMLQPCPPLRIKACHEEFEEVFGANTTEIQAGERLIGEKAGAASSPATGASVSEPEKEEEALPAYVPLAPVVFPPASVLDTPVLLTSSDPDCPTSCVVYPEDYKYPGSLDLISIPRGCWRESERLRQVALAAATVANGSRAATPAEVSPPSGWVDIKQCEEAEQEFNVAVCPPRPCPEYCGPLEQASILCATVYAACIVLLLGALFQKRLMRSALGRFVRRVFCGAQASYDPAAAELEQRIRVPPSALGLEMSSTTASPAPRFTVDDEDEGAPSGAGAAQHLSATGEPVHPRSGEVYSAAGSGGGSDGASAGNSDLPSVWHPLRLALRALCLCGSREYRCLDLLRLWWRHMLFLFGLGMMVLLLLYELANLFWLSEAHCRDFLVSTLGNFLMILMAALLVLALILRHKERIVRPDANPFELAGLLDEQDHRQGAGDSAADGEEAEEEGDEEQLDLDDDDEFGLASPYAVAGTQSQRQRQPDAALASASEEAEAQARLSLQHDPATSL